MRISDLKSWISDNDLRILFSLIFVSWVIYNWHHRGMTCLAIALIFLAV